MLFFCSISGEVTKHGNAIPTPSDLVTADSVWRAFIDGYLCGHGRFRWYWKRLAFGCHYFWNNLIYTGKMNLTGTKGEFFVSIFFVFVSCTLGPDACCELRLNYYRDMQVPIHNFRAELQSGVGSVLPCTVLPCNQGRASINKPTSQVSHFQGSCLRHLVAGRDNCIHILIWVGLQMVFEEGYLSWTCSKRTSGSPHLYGGMCFFPPLVLLRCGLVF